MTTERREQQHERDLRLCLRALAGDLLRAIAGGKASKIVERIGAANEAIENWFDGRQCIPFGQDKVEAMLWLDEDDDEKDDRGRVERALIVAALRTVSARMFPLPNIRDDWFNSEEIDVLIARRRKQREKWQLPKPEPKQPAKVAPKRVTKAERRLAIRKQAQQAQRWRMDAAATPIEGG